MAGAFFFGVWASSSSSSSTSGAATTGVFFGLLTLRARFLGVLATAGDDSKPLTGTLVVFVRDRIGPARLGEPSCRSSSCSASKTTRMRHGLTVAVDCDVIVLVGEEKRWRPRGRVGVGRVLTLGALSSARGSGEEVMAVVLRDTMFAVVVARGRRLCWWV